MLLALIGHHTREASWVHHPGYIQRTLSQVVSWCSGSFNVSGLLSTWSVRWRNYIPDVQFVAEFSIFSFAPHAIQKALPHHNLQKNQN